MNPWKNIADGIYRDKRTGNLFERPKINGRPTWRKLNASVLKHARVELAARRAEQAKAAQGLALDPYRPSDKRIGEILKLYVAASCPRRGAKRVGTKLYQEERRTLQLLKWWSDMPTAAICQKTCDDYAAYRRRTVRKNSTGGRAIDLELSTLSSAMQWASRRDYTPDNPFDKFSREKNADNSKRQNCREFRCRNADELHALAAHYFESKRTDVFGWQLLFESYFGPRTGETVRLRMDAGENEPGYDDGTHLWLGRDKGGVNPWALIHPAARQMVEAHKVWHAERFPRSPWYFPSYKKPSKHIGKSALTKSLARVSQLVIGEKRTSHGCRAFYVTTRRSEGASDAQIAAEIGDKTGAPIIVSTYGAIPDNWRGGKALKWLPEGEPAWAKWLVKAENVVEFPSDSESMEAVRK
jgi:integrase